MIQKKFDENPNIITGFIPLSSNAEPDYSNF